MTSTSTTRHEDVLDLRDDNGTGYRIEWNRSTSSAEVVLFEQNALFLRNTLSGLDDRRMNHLMTTPRSVAWAVRDDAEEGYLREYFCDGYETVRESGLTIDFDLDDPTSNDFLRCSVIVSTPGDPDDHLGSLSFVVSRQYLLEATEVLEHLVMS